MTILFYYPTDPRGQAFFQFQHAQAHATLTWQHPATSTLANYLLDPMVRPSSLAAPDVWAVDHQQAHDDAANRFAVQPSLPLPDEATGSGWWTFVNDREHSALATQQLIASVS